MSIDDQGGGQVNQTETILKALVDDLEQNQDRRERSPRPRPSSRTRPLAPTKGGLALSTLMERYAERPRLPLIIAPTYFKEVVRTGVANKIWLYYDSAINLAYDNLAPVADIVLDADHMVMLPEEVTQRGIPIWSPDPPPPKPKPDDDDDDQDDGGPPSQGPTTSAHAEGEPRHALAEVLTTAQDGQWTFLGSISIAWSGEDSAAATSMSALRTLMGQISGGEASVRCSLVCEFNGGGQLNTEYQGSYQRYQAMANTLETQASQADRSLADLTISITYANGLSVDAPEISDLREAFGLVSLGPTEIEIRRHDGSA